MPRGTKLPTGETIEVRTINKLRRRAQAESWAWRFATHEPRRGWHEHAACKHTDTATWFDTDRKVRNAMLAFCNGCPARLDCGAEAMLTERRDSALVHGGRAGLTAMDRYRAARVYDRLVQTVCVPEEHCESD